MPDNEFGYGTVAPAVTAKGNLLNPSAPIASVAMPKVIAPVAPPANAAPSSVQMPNVPQPQISQQQIQQMGDNTTSAVGNMVGNVMPGIIGTGGLALAGYGLSKIPSMLGKGKEEGKAPPESKQGIPVEVEKTQKVEEPKKEETKYHLEQDHKELSKEELNNANEVFNTLDNIKTEPTTPKPETSAQQTIKTELKPVETNNPTSPIATTEPNPVVSGEGTSPLHNPEGQGLTQVEATSASATPNAAFPAETNTTKESGNLTNSAENPTQGGAEQVKKPVKPKETTTTVEIPEGRIPAYPNPKRNKQGKDVIGQGGWHWYQGQMGSEAEENWLRQFGRTNQSYADVKQAMKEGRLQGPEVVEGKGGAFPREKHVPNYIKGHADIGAMGATALGSLQALMAVHNIKQDLENAKEAEKSGDIQMRNAHYRNIFSNIPILGDLLVDTPEQYAAMREEERKKKAK